MHHNTITVKGVFTEAYAIMKPKFWRVIGQYLVVFCVLGFLDYGVRNNLFLSIVTSILFAFISTSISLGYAEKGNFSFRTFAKEFTLKGLGYFTAGYLLAKIIILGGFLLLIIPGIIAGIWLFLMKYIVIEEHIKPIKALKKSVALTKGHRMKIFECVFAAILLNIAGALCLLVGLLFTAPLTLIAFAVIYKKLASGPVTEEEVSSGEEIVVAPHVDVEVVPAV